MTHKANIDVASEWRGESLWWRIDGDWISDVALRAWCANNMDSPRCYVDVIRQCHVDAYSKRTK